MPPLGGALRALVIIDESLQSAGALVFDAFSHDDFFEIPYDQYALLEQPRVASFVFGGELPAMKPEARESLS